LAVQLFFCRSNAYRLLGLEVTRSAGYIQSSVSLRVLCELFFFFASWFHRSMTDWLTRPPMERMIGRRVGFTVMWMVRRLSLAVVDREVKSGGD